FPRFSAIHAVCVLNGSELPSHSIEKVESDRQEKHGRHGSVFASVLSMLSSKLPYSRTPRFKVGDLIMVVGPSEHKGQSGVVVQVVAHSGDFVHRYNVEFQDGSVSRYFGFELELALRQSA